MTTSPNKKTTPRPPASYEAAVQELEQLSADIESGQLPLEQMLSGYQRATWLLHWCRNQLQTLQTQIQRLDEDGAVQPWEPDSSVARRGRATDD